MQRVKELPAQLSPLTAYFAAQFTSIISVC